MDMNEHGTWRKASWSELVLVVIGVPLWAFTLYDLVTRHLPMSRSLSEWVCLFVLPIFICKIIINVRRRAS